MERFLRAMTTSTPEFGLGDTASSATSNFDQFRQATEAVMRQIADGDGGVVLGRASMVILAGRPDVLCVRLDGPAEARIRHVVEREMADEATARREQRETDDARESYGRIFYNVRQDDPKLYHVMLDPTVLSIEACIDIVLRAASDRLGLEPITGPSSEQ
jgi:cytidylate kinase